MIASSRLFFTFLLFLFDKSITKLSEFDLIYFHSGKFFTISELLFISQFTQLFKLSVINFHFKSLLADDIHIKNAAIEVDQITRAQNHQAFIISFDFKFLLEIILIIVSVNKILKIASVIQKVDHANISE